MKQFDLKKYLVEQRAPVNEEHKFAPDYPIYSDDGKPIPGGVMHPATLVGGPRNGMQFGTSVYGEPKNRGGLSYSDTEHYYIDPKKPQNEKGHYEFHYSKTKPDYAGKK